MAAMTSSLIGLDVVQVILEFLQTNGYLPTYKGFLPFMATYFVRILILCLTMYEAERIFFFSIVIFITWGKLIMSIITQLDKFFGENLSEINGGMRDHFQFYNRLVILLDLIEMQWKTTVTMSIVGGGVAVVSTTFVAVKFHEIYPWFLTAFYACGAAFLFWLGLICLGLIGMCDESCGGLLERFKMEGLLLRMKGRGMKLYLAEVKSLRRIRFLVGLGHLQFGVFSKSSKSDVMGYIVDETINILMTF